MRDGLQAVAFDFDGTLADTREAIVATVAQTLSSLSVAPLPPEQVVARMGLPLAEVFVAAGVPAAGLHDAVQLYRRRFPENCTRVALFPGVLQGLQALAAAGVPLGIVSSRGRGSLLPLLSQLKIERFFCEVLGEEDALQKKPAPHLVLSLGERLRIAPASMLVVGDTSFDIEMGHAAGARTCAVSYGSHDLATLRAARPHYLFDSRAELHPRAWGPA